MIFRKSRRVTIQENQGGHLCNRGKHVQAKSNRVRDPTKVVARNTACSLASGRALTAPFVEVTEDVGTMPLLVGVTSPSAVATPPRSVLSIAQILLIPSTTEGRLTPGALRKSVWLVCSKLREEVSVRIWQS